MRSARIAISSVLTLVATLLNPLAPATAVDTVTKTITVKKADGSAYANALVALSSWDDVNNKPEYTPAVTANSQGVAEVVIPNTKRVDGVIVQPAAGDLTHALSQEYPGFVTGENESLTQTLNLANVAVKLLTANGADAGFGAHVSYPGTFNAPSDSAERTLLRSGAVGIDILSSLSSASCSVVSVSGNQDAGDFTAQYGLKLVSGTPKIYAEKDCTTELPKTTSGSMNVYELQMAAANLTGRVQTSSGSTLTLPAQVTGEIEFFPSDSEGGPDFTQWLGRATLSSTSTYSAKLPAFDVATKVHTRIHISGSLTIPTQILGSFWVATDGKYSLTENGTFVTPSQFSLDQRISSAAPNFQMKVVRDDTLAAEPSFISVYQQNPATDCWFGPGYSGNGTASFILPDGTFNLNVWPTSAGRASADVILSVDAGQPRLQIRGTSEYLTADAQGVFTVTTKSPNVNLRIMSPTDATKFLNNAYVNVIDDSNDNYVAGGGGGQVSMAVAAGTYRLEIYPNTGTLATKRYSLTVTGSGFTVLDGSTPVVANQDGSVSVTADQPNVVATVQDTNGGSMSLYPRVNVGGQLQKYVSNNRWDYVSNSNATKAGAIGFKVTEPGTYRIRFNAWGSSDFAPTISNSFTITNGSTSVDLGAIHMNAPTVKVKVRYSGGSSDLPFSNVVIFQDNDYVGDANTEQGGVAGLVFESAGSYVIEVQPPFDNSTANSSPKRYNATVTSNNGTLSVAISGKSLDSSGAFVLELGVPNITGSVKNPDGTTFKPVHNKWVNAALQKYVGDHWEWISNTNVKSDGSFGFAASDQGTYRVRLEPENVANAVLTTSDEFVINSGNQSGFTKAFGAIQLKQPNFKFYVRTATGTTNLAYSGVELRKDNQWLDWINTDQTGLGTYRFESAGTYEMVVHPNDDSSANSRKTYSFTVTAGANAGEFAVASQQGLTAESNGSYVLRLATPNITGKVVDSTGAAVGGSKSKGWVNISVQRLSPVTENWEWANYYSYTRADGTFSLNIDAPGKYRLRLEPGGRTDVALTTTSTFEITSANLSTFTKAFGSITLKSPTLKGKVFGPDGTTSVPNSQVVAVDQNTGQEMWEYSRQTDQNGAWTMTLPQGSYSIYARAPYRNVSYGNSNLVENVTVDSSGVATVTGRDAANLNVNLTNPTWSGVLLEPGSSTTPISQGSICLSLGTGKSSWMCTEVDNQGRWAFSKPAGFTGFDASSQLMIFPRTSTFTERRYQGATDVTAVLGAYTAGNTYSNITLRPLAPNTNITVKAGTTPVPNVWVSIERPNVGWLGGGVTDANGVAHLNIANPTLAFDVRVDLNGNREVAQNYASTRKSYAASDIVQSNGVFNTEVSLEVPNLKGTLSEPSDSSNPGAAIAYSWIEAFNESTREWAGGSSTDSQGRFSLFLTAPTAANTSYTYTVTARSNNSTNLLSQREYTVGVATGGAVTVQDKRTGVTVNPVSGLYGFTLSSPSVVGKVVSTDNTTGVSDSWIELMKIVNGQRNWLAGTNSKFNGDFGLALDSGSYELVANVPWQLSGIAKSSTCSIQVAAGAMTTTSSACVVDGKVKLALRAPNLKFKLVNGATALQNAWVSVNVGNWNTGAQADKDGFVSLFIDSDEIAAKNPSFNGSYDLNFWVEPGWGRSDIVRWSCKSGDAKPICDSVPDVTIGQQFAQTIIASPIQAMTPNTTITIKRPSLNTAVGQGGWATLYQEENGWRRWIGHANTDLDGKATFNIENSADAAARYTLEVNAPWADRQSYSMKRYTNLSFSQLNNQSFNLATPNLTLNMKQALGAGVSKWGYVHVDEVNAANNYNWVDWVGGSSVDVDGLVNLTLGSSKTFKINAYPGFGSVGTYTSCYVSVDSSGVVSPIVGKCTALGTVTNGVADFTLSAGNVQGFVKKSDNTTAAAGAIVFAQAYSGSTLVDGVTFETTVAANGSYGMQLDSAYTWKLKVFYVNAPGEVLPQRSKLTEIVLSATVLQGLSNGSSINTDIVLEAK